MLDEIFAAIDKTGITESLNELGEGSWGIRFRTPFFGVELTATVYIGDRIFQDTFVMSLADDAESVRRNAGYSALYILERLRATIQAAR